MQCFNCGEAQKEGNTFCTKCGTRLTGAQVLPAHTDDPPPTSTSTSAHEEEQRILKELKEALKGVEGQRETLPHASTLLGGAKKKAWLAGVFLLLLLIHP